MNVTELRKSIINSTRISFSRSGGSGGQNVNKVNTKVTLRLTLEDICGLTKRERTAMADKLKARLSGGGKEIVIQCDRERSQYANIKRAFARLENLIVSAARLPKTRQPTGPTKASKEQRLFTKKLTSLKKTRREKPRPPD